MPFSSVAAALPARIRARRRAGPRGPFCRREGPAILKFPGKDEGLVVLGDRPLVAETPESLLDDDTTPIEKFYIRNNGQIPDATENPDTWKITIDGEVNNKLELTLGELKTTFKPMTQRMVLECGGNGRSFFSPPARGNQWTNGGAGCAEWTGVRLADVLKAAGLKPAAKYTAHYGADPHLSGDPTKPSLSRGMRIEKAMDANTLIVWAHERRSRCRTSMAARCGSSSPAGPARLSQKWLTRITIRDNEHDGQGMTGISYRVAIKPMVPGDKAERRTSASSNRCRCARSSPIRRTAPSSPPAPGARRCAARPGPAISG